MWQEILKTFRFLRELSPWPPCEISEEYCFVVRESTWISELTVDKDKGVHTSWFKKCVGHWLRVMIYFIVGLLKVVNPLHLACLIYDKIFI